MAARIRVKIKFVDFWHPSTLQGLEGNSLYHILQKRYDLELSDDPDFVLYSAYGCEHLKYDCIRICYLGENVRPNFRECDYAFSFELEQSERNTRLPLYRLYPEYPELLKPRRPDEIMAENRKFCCFLNSNDSAQERLRFFDRLSEYKRVDAGGKTRNNIGYLVKEKLAFFRQYKFSMAFENSQYPGYATEKLMHALVAGTVPIYWGNSAMQEDFNPAAFINCHDYDSFEAVIERVKEVDRDDALYRSYLAAPFFPGGKENKYAREENYLGVFDRIFTSGRSFIPAYVKKLQQARYFLWRARVGLKKALSRVLAVGKSR
jgi:hypothetical protein